MKRHIRELEALAKELAAGRIDVAAFLRAANQPGIADLGDVTLDLDRHRRCGFPEVVFGEGKSAETLVKIVRQLAEQRMKVLVTRLDVRKARAS